MHWVILMACVGNFDNLPETRALQVGLGVKNPPVNAGDARDHRFGPWVGKIPWTRKWQLTPVFLPGKFHGQRSLVDYSLWSHKRVRQHLLWQSSGEDSALPLQRTHVGFLVIELRSHMLHLAAERKKKKSQTVLSD